MASATILLRRSVINGGNQVSCRRYLSAAAKQSHGKILSASVSSIRQFASSAASPKYEEAFVNGLLKKIQTLEGSVETLRKQKELLLRSREEAIGSVKPKHPLLKEIDSEISKNKFDGKKAKKSISDFKIVRDYSWPWSTRLEGSFAADKISLAIPKPICKQMRLNIQVRSSGIFGQNVKFSCTVTDTGSYKIDTIKYGAFRKEVAFEQLPENVQREMHTYLELRGINSYTANSLYEYVFDKICNKQLKGLYGKFQNMV